MKTYLSDLTFKKKQNNVDDIITVSEEAIIKAMRMIWKRMKIIVELPASFPLSSIMEGYPDVKDKRVGIILSDGNVDLDRISLQVFQILPVNIL